MANASLLGSRQSRFYVNLSRNWLFPEVEKKYEPFLKRGASPWKSVVDYINSCITAVTFPSFETNSVQQQVKNEKRSFRGGTPWYELGASRSMTMTFRTTESYLSWFIMNDQIRYYVDYSNVDKKHLDPINLILMDNFGQVTNSFLFNGIVFEKMSSIELSYSGDNPESKTFTCDFKYLSVHINEPGNF